MKVSNKQRSNKPVMEVVERAPIPGAIAKGVRVVEHTEESKPEPARDNRVHIPRKTTDQKNLTLKQLKIAAAAVAIICTALLLI